MSTVQNVNVLREALRGSDPLEDVTVNFGDVNFGSFLEDHMVDVVEAIREVEDTTFVYEEAGRDDRGIQWTGVTFSGKADILMILLDELILLQGTYSQQN